MRWFGLVLALLLSACSQTNPVLTTLGSAWHDPSAAMNFNPSLEYLQVQALGRKSYLVLGVRQVQGEEMNEYWYSADKEMLHLRNGRLIEALGMTREIRSTTLTAPAWLTLSTQAQVWVRERDLMPYYQYGVRQFVISQQVKPTEQEKAWAPRATHWVQEQIKTSSATQGAWIYDELFALDDHGHVLYSNQCVAPDLCLQMTYLGHVGKP